MVKSWQDLEDFACSLIANDHPVKPAGSGSGKKEEDVVGDTTITQCKYTSDKNMSILSKDLDRLLEASQLQDKSPLFITSNGTNTVISIPITENNDIIIQHLLNLYISLTHLDKVYFDINSVTNLEHLKGLDKKISRLKSIYKLIDQEFKQKFVYINNVLKKKYDDLTMYDLFEGGKDGVK